MWRRCAAVVPASPDDNAIVPSGGGGSSGSRRKAPPKAKEGFTELVSQPGDSENIIWLNVYDLNRTAARVNRGLRRAGLGLFHCGVQVRGSEVYFARGSSARTGVFSVQPRGHAAHVFRVAVCLGESALSTPEIRDVISRAVSAWSENTYHPIRCNCIHFASWLVDALQVPEPFPSWVRGAAAVGARVPFVPTIAGAAMDGIGSSQSSQGSTSTMGSASSQGSTVSAGRTRSNDRTGDSGSANDSYDHG